MPTISLTAQPDTSALRKARGAFFTRPEVTRYICEWAIRAPTDRVYEPSCGEADFLVAAGRRLGDLGAARVDGELLAGAELHEGSAREALAELNGLGMTANIAVSDFFDVDLATGSFDAIVGNPPYVRYQAFYGEPRAKAKAAALKAGVRLSGLASSWAAFTVRSAQLVRPNGRLGFVLPAELLTTNYAAPVRRYLAERFASLRLIMFDERVFPGVLAEVVLLLAEGAGPSDCIKVSQARNLSGLADPPVTHWRPKDLEAKWSPALLATNVAESYAEVLRRDHFTELAGWGRTDLGMVTGNNRWFCLTPDRARELTLKDARPAPPGVLGGSGAERRMAGGLGPKKVDVSWATEESGLLLAISVKTINFRDRQSNNFQKNLTNRRSDMLMESVTLHRRFPFAVLAGLLILDHQAGQDHTQTRRSTFENAHSRYRLFTGRDDPADRDEQFERLWVMLVNANPFTPVYTTYNVGDHTNGVNLGQAFDELIDLVATRNPDFYEVLGGKLLKLR